MSISSTGLYGSATIVNSDLFNDVSDLHTYVCNYTHTHTHTHLSTMIPLSTGATIPFFFIYAFFLNTPVHNDPSEHRRYNTRQSR